MAEARRCMALAVVLAACGGSSATPDAPPPVDGALVDGTVDGPPGDAPSDGPADAPADAAVDAPVDAPRTPSALALDPTFGTGGLAAHGLPRSADEAQAAAVQADGKLIVVGSTPQIEDTASQFAGQVVVARFTAAGALDPTFGGDGIVLVPIGTRATGLAVTVQTDGKVLVGGDVRYTLATTAPYVARLTSAGELDATFGTGGVHVLAPSGVVFALAVDASGNIAAAGTLNQAGVNKLMVARLSPNGALDTGFAGTGIAALAIGTRALAFAVAFGPGGTVVAAGETGTTSDLAIARLAADGTPDATFGGGDGIVTHAVGANSERASAVAIDAGGRVVIAGRAAIATASDTAAIVMRFEADGDLDATFGGGDALVVADATNLIDAFFGVALVTGDKLIAAGQHGGTARVFRFLADGELDTSFDADGQADADLGTASPEAFATAGGDLYVAGTALVPGQDRSTMVAVRLDAAGARDLAFGAAGTATAASGATQELATGVIANPDGTVVAVGFGHGVQQRRAVLAKFLATGLPDPSFGGGVGAVRLAEIAIARGLHRTSSGELVVAGDNAIGGGFRYTLARYTASGDLDPTFAGTGSIADPVVDGGNGSPRALAVDAAGNYIVVGNAGSGFSPTNAGLIRVTPAGALDTSFSTDGRLMLDLGTASDELRAVDTGPGDTIVAVTGARTVIRLENDGDLDPTLDGDGIVTPAVAGMLTSAVRVQADGKIVIAGYTPSPPALVVARLTPSGALDTSFGTGGVVTYSVGGVADSLVPLGALFGGPALLLDGGAIRVSATRTNGADESMLLVSLSVQDGALLDAVTADGPSYWTGFACAPAPGGLVIAGRGYTAAGGTDLGIARFSTQP